MRKILAALAFAVIGAYFIGADGCGDNKPSSDTVQQQQQEEILKQGTNVVGMPSIVNFRERRMMKDILELRDQNDLVTYTYLFSEQTGKLIYLGTTIGFGLPYSTQFTNPQKIAERNTVQSGSYAILPQADPNGLFSPASSEGTWVLMYDPITKKTLPQYIEPRILVLTFKLADNDPRLQH